MHCARVRRTVFHGPRRRAGRHRKGLAAGADRGPIQCPSGPRPNSPQSRLAPAKFRELPALRGPLLLFGAEFGRRSAW